LVGELGVEESLIMLINENEELIQYLREGDMVRKGQKFKQFIKHFSLEGVVNSNQLLAKLNLGQSP
jgi:hypothetical protein